MAALVATVALAAPILSSDPAAGADSGAVEARVVVSPLGVGLELRAGSVRVGETVRADARIDNLSSATLAGIVVVLRADPNGLSIKAPTVAIGQLRPGKSKSVAWTICGAIPGSYVLLARVSLAGQSIDSPARVLTVLPGGRKAC